MDENLAQSVKATANERFAAAYDWLVGDNAAISHDDAVRGAANVAADEIMYMLGMREYAAFQEHIGNLDVATWLINKWSAKPISSKGE